MLLAIETVWHVLTNRDEFGILAVVLVIIHEYTFCHQDFAF